MSAEVSVFVDSAAWIALIDASDRRHRDAAAFWRRAAETSRPSLTSDYVLDETYTLLRRRPKGLLMATRIHDLVAASDLIRVAQVDEEVQGAAWDLFTAYTDQILSFTDCTSFALMERHHLVEAFTFDADFLRVGFQVVPSG